MDARINFLKKVRDTKVKVSSCHRLTNEEKNEFNRCEKMKLVFRLYTDDSDTSEYFVEITQKGLDYIFEMGNETESKVKNLNNRSVFTSTKDKFNSMAFTSFGYFSIATAIVAFCIFIFKN